MLEWNLLSCLIFLSIVARAFLSVILVLSWSSERTNCSSGVQSIHFQVGTYGSTGILTTSFCSTALVAQEAPMSATETKAAIRPNIKKGA